MERDRVRSVDLGPIDDFLQHINDQDTSLIHLYLGRRYQVLDGLGMLKALVIDPPQDMVEDGRAKEIESIASKVASTIYLYLKKYVDQNNALRLGRLVDLVSKLEPKMSLINKLLTETQRKMDLAHVESLFELLYKDDESLVMSPLRKQLSRELAFLLAALSDHRQNLFAYDSFKDIESMAREAGSIISAFELHHMDQEMALQLCDLLKSTLTPLSHFMFEAWRRICGTQVYYRATIGQPHWVDNLVEKLEHLVTAKVDSIGPLKFPILRLQRKLQSLGCHLRGITESRKEDADVKDLIRNITNLVFKVEYTVDAFLVKKVSLFRCVFDLETILEESKGHLRQVKLESGDPQSMVKTIILWVGNEVRIIPIVSKSQSSEFQLKQVFNHHNIVHSFSIRTWSSASSYKERKKEFFLRLLDNIAHQGTYLDFEKGILWHPSYGPNVPHGEKIAYTSDMSEDELKRLVVLLLNRGPYFIILEDVLDIHVFHDILTVLPKNRNGSRVLLITRSVELAICCNNYYRSDFLIVVAGYASKSQTNNRPSDDDVVGFKKETETMFDCLVKGRPKLHIISIVGMPGEGKTTLAKKLYDDLAVVNHFDTRAWCYVSQAYQKRELLLALLAQLVPCFDGFCFKSDEELAEMLYKHLKGRRFLIVMDDMWKTDAWNDLSRCFPNDNNRSRIVFTTRLQNLASHSKSDSMVQRLYPLSDAESWDLLKKKVFPNDSCPIDLLEVGKQIAKSCKGLPISVVLIAGCLKKMGKKVHFWEQIAKSIPLGVLGGEGTLGKDVIELSYNHLPDHLKPCFLYCGAFLKDGEIPVSKLVRLWIAEGFIEHTKLKSFEDVAEDYLEDLIARSLVVIAQEKSKGGVKTCHVHDLLREFCLMKAMEDKLFEVMNISDPVLNHVIPHSHIFPNNLGACRIIRNNFRTKNDIDFIRNCSIMLRYVGNFLRSVLIFGASDLCRSNAMPLMFLRFKYLRILDLGDINTASPFKGIDVLVLLKYLAVQGIVDLIPSSISNLWFLETFLVKGLSSTIVKVPDSIWDMEKLRHLHINDCASFDLETHRLENSSLLVSLQTFSTPSLTYGDDMEKVLRRLPGIQKLKCIFLDSWDDVTNCNRFPELGFLNQLLSLKVFYNGERKFPCQFNIPSNLMKLTLSNFHMPWNQISLLATLPNLEVLKLLVSAFEGKTWEMEDEVFPKLKFLKLESLDVVKWVAFPDHFPRLQRLLVHKCEQLEAIPHDIGDISTLYMIEVMWCNPSAANSAKRIQDEQLEFGHEELKVQIHPKIGDSNFSS